MRWRWQIGLKVAFIGGGNMGEAMLAALLQKGVSQADEVAVSDISEEKRRYLAACYQVAVARDSLTTAVGKEVVVLAVKPQNMPEVLAGLRGHLEPSQLVLSIAAGIKMAKIATALSHPYVVRAMPNTPARIGLGMTGWVAADAVTEEQRKKAQAILAAMGKEIMFGDEACLDMVTAVSGSGPAYFFLFAEALMEAAVGLGLARADAQTLVRQTMLGAAQLAEKSGVSFAELRQAVTSRGGTTERALKVFEEANFREIVARAVRAAYERAQELGLG